LTGRTVCHDRIQRLQFIPRQGNWFISAASQTSRMTRPLRGRDRTWMICPEVPWAHWIRSSVQRCLRKPRLLTTSTIWLLLITSFNRRRSVPMCLVDPAIQRCVWSQSTR